MILITLFEKLRRQNLVSVFFNSLSIEHTIEEKIAAKYIYHRKVGGEQLYLEMGI